MDLRYIALPISRYYLEMSANPLVGSRDAVKGKKIGLSSPGSLGDAPTGRDVSRAQGWSAGDMHKVFLKSTPAEVSALENGAVDAIVTQPPTGTQTRAKGFKRVMNCTGYPAAANAYTVKKTYPRRRTKAAVSRLREVQSRVPVHPAQRQGRRWTRTSSSTAETATKKLAEYSYDFFEPLWARVPTRQPRPGRRRSR